MMIVSMVSEGNQSWLLMIIVSMESECNGVISRGY